MQNYRGPSHELAVSRGAPQPPAEPAAAVRDRDRRLLRIWLLTAAFTALLALLAWLVPGDLFLSARVYRALHPALPQPPPVNYDAQLKHDPPLGIKLAGAPLCRAVPDPRAGILLIYVGDRACCMHADLAGWEQEARSDGPPTVLLASASPRNLPEQVALLRRGLGLKSPVVADTARLLQRRLNAFCVPRAYLLSPGWRLRWLQRDVRGLGCDPFGDPTFQTALRGGTQ